MKYVQYINSLIKDQNSNIDPNKRPSNDQGIEISENLKNTQKSFSVSGIYDPEENNFNLDMWSNSEGTRIKDTIDRIDKINLSSFADEMFTSTILTNSYLPFNNMTEEEFCGICFTKHRDCIIIVGIIGLLVCHCKKRFF